MANGLKHLLLCLFDIHISSLVNYLFMSLFHVQFGLFTFVLFSFESASYSLHPRPLSEIWLKIFSCTQNLSLYPLIGIFYRAKNLILINSDFQFFLLWIVHSVSSLKIFSYAFIF